MISVTVTGDGWKSYDRDFLSISIHGIIILNDFINQLIYLLGYTIDG